MRLLNLGTFDGDEEVKWMFMNGFECENLISTATECLNSCQFGGGGKILGDNFDT